MMSLMKINFYRKKSFRSYAYGILAFIISLISIVFIFSTEYGFGDNLPRYYLFENPLNDRYGDIIERHLTVIIWLPLFFLICFIFSIVDSSGEKVLNSIKRNKKDAMIGILFVVFIVPWILILSDFITISIGYIGPYNPDRYFPLGNIILFVLFVLIGFVGDSLSKK